MTTQLPSDDLGELSPTVTDVLAATPADVTAVELARDILGHHPEYGGRRAGGLRLGADGTTTRRGRRTWLADVRALYEEAAAPLLHGRLVVIGLAQLEPTLRVALDADGFYDALVSELTVPIETLWARRAPTTVRDEVQAQPAPTSEPDQLWPLLSPSARAAIEHAAELSSGGTVHTEQLVLGLYDKPDGPTRRFLDQSGVTRAKLDDALAQAVEVHPADPGPPTELHALPPVSRHVAQALRHAAAFADDLGSRTIRSRHLFCGVLTLENCDVTRALSADLDVTVARFRAWLQRPSMPADDAQQVEHRVLAGGISADLVDPDQGIPREEDDLGVSTYVAMMATAIAREDTKLPLSIGLFGEWGSGKSYFMGLLRKQVQDLASSGDPAYCSGIVQIGFNAWSYADANLWASLGDEIFRELAGPGDDEQEAEDQKRRERLRTWLADEQGRVKELEAARAAAAAEVAKLRAELDRREPDRRDKALTLLRATVEAVRADEQKAAELRSAWEKLGLKDETEQARVLVDAVTGTRDAVTAVGRAAAYGNRRYVVAAILAIGLVLIVVGLTSSGVLSQFPSRVLTGTGFATLLAAAVTFATVTKRVADGVRSVADLADQIRQRTEAGENEAVKAALDQVRAAEAREQMLQAQLDQVVARVGELGRELVELSPGQRLYAFLAERAASEDYRRQLGLIATIRRDFERLARLQEQWRNDKDGRSPRPIDRIVLYIDDLDRCTPRQVVEVLQAVHLLLAIDLFVVVVGVDPRWLLHSLRDQYRSTLTAPTPGVGTAGGDEDAAAGTSRGRDDGTVQEEADRLMLSTPHDYLEKIFNVPFVLPAMTPRGFDAMIRRLSITRADDDHAVHSTIRTETPSLSHEGETTVVTGTSVAPPVEEGSEIAAVQHGDTVAPTPLTEPELQALSSLAPLVRSPREAKRLLNLYRMLRSTQDLSDASRFLGADGDEGEFQVVAMLLGLLTANPQLLGQILFAPPDPEQALLGGICHRAAQGTWGVFLDGLRPRRVGERWRNDLCDDLSEGDRAEWELLVERAGPTSALVKLPDLTTFETWAPHVARFSFLLAPVTGGDRS